MKNYKNIITYLLQYSDLYNRQFGGARSYTLPSCENDSDCVPGSGYCHPVDKTCQASPDSIAALEDELEDELDDMKLAVDTIPQPKISSRTAREQRRAEKERLAMLRKATKAVQRRHAQQQYLKRGEKFLGRRAKQMKRLRKKAERKERKRLAKEKERLRKIMGEDLMEQVLTDIADLKAPKTAIVFSDDDNDRGGGGGGGGRGGGHHGVLARESVAELASPRRGGKRTRRKLKQKGGNRNNKVRVTLLHAIWCGYCKDLKPEWDQFKNMYGNHRNIVFKEYEETTNPKTHKLMAKYKAQGFPTIVFKTPRGTFNYEGERTVTGLKNELEKHI